MIGEYKIGFDIRLPFLKGDKVKLKEEIKNMNVYEDLKLYEGMKFEGIQKVEKIISILGVILEDGYLYKFSMLERVE